MGSANTWQSSRKIWISLFIIANALDMLTTFVALSDPNGIGVEINPVVHYLGWPVAITFRLGWIAIVVWLWFIRWNKHGAYKAYLMILTTAILIMSLFNVGQQWNLNATNRIKCAVFSTKYGQDLLKSQLDINEIEYFVSAC